MEEISLSSLLLRGTAIILLVAANGFFVAAEFAMVASRRTRIETLVRQGDTKAKLARRAIQSIDRYISGTQLGITAASLGLGWVGEPLLASAIERGFAFLPGLLGAIATHAVAATIAFLLITFLHIVLGELAPKALALLYPEATSRWVAGPLIGFTEVMNPFIWVLNGSANALLRLFGLRAPSEAERVHRPEEIVMLVRQSEQAGELEREDVQMIEGVLEFTEKNAREVMTPRTEIVGLPADSSIDEAMDLITKAGRSRYPVYRESLDDIVGIVHIKQILGALQQGRGTSVESIMRDAIYVPSTREVEDVLADLKRHKAQMAVVLDEYGGTAGIVTMEDLLEEIVGEIYDEYEEAETLPPAGTTEITVPGDTEIADLNKRFAVSITDTDYHTIGGYVFGKLGRLPSEGDRVQSDNLVVQVTAMDGRRVDQVKIVGLGKNGE